MNKDRLESWKEIAAYLDRGVRTVQRWEKQEGLPVQRHEHEKLGTVFAFRSDIDTWWESRRAELAAKESSSALLTRVLGRRASWLAAGIAGAAMAIAAVSIWPSNRRPEPAVLLSPVPVTTLPGSEYFPTFSPDGNHVAFSWVSRSHPVDIYTKSLGSEVPLQITRNVAADLGPAWSPDGQWVAFLRGSRVRDQKRDVLVVPSIGGPERKVGETLPDWGPFLEWTPDSRGLIFSYCKAPDPCLLKLVWLDTLEEQLLTEPPSGPGGDTAPALSADGRRLLFVRRRGGHTARVFLQQLDETWRAAGQPEPLTPDDLFATAPTWSSDERGFFYISGEVGLSMMLWQRALPQTATPRLLATLGDTFFEPGIAVHENRLITMDLRIDTNVRKVRPDGEELAGAGVALTESNRIDTFPHFSPDGRKIAFHSTRYGGSDVFVMQEDGSNVVQLTSLGLDRARTPRWGPDGAQIVFVGGATKGDIHVMNAVGGKPTQLTSGPADDSLPSWSPDGRWVYFTSDRSGAQEVWRIPVESGEAVQVTSGGGYRPIASPDGKFVYYTKKMPGAPHGAPLCRVPAAGGDEEQVFERPVFHPENFEISTGHVYYTTSSPVLGTRALRVYDLETSQDRELAHLGGSLSRGISVSPDDGAIIFSQTDSYEADLVMFEIP